MGNYSSRPIKNVVSWSESWGKDEKGIGRQLDV